MLVKMEQPHNPYSPPKAPLMDGEPADSKPRPQLVDIALILLAIAILISLFDDLRFRVGNATLAYVLKANIWPLAKSGFAAWICFQVARRSGVARTAIAVLTFCSVFYLGLQLLLVMRLPEGSSLALSRGRLIMLAIPNVLSVAALILLFLPPARRWFPRRIEIEF